jgi:hypothetical protein
MTGPEHYLAAEQYAEMGEESNTIEGAVPHYALAQIHATLALASAIAETTMVEHTGPAFGYGSPMRTRVAGWPDDGSTRPA